VPTQEPVVALEEIFNDEINSAIITKPILREVRLAANRLTFGARLDDLNHINEIGIDAFIEEQLAHDQLDEDEEFRAQMGALALIRQPARDLLSYRPQEVLDELQQATMLRAVYSKRQLYELLVDFWTNHFNIHYAKNTVRYLKVTDDREVVRPHALGKFRDLLGASAHSPAMLVYLDNDVSTAGNPNENYARELMELHTIGTDAFGQADVHDLARALTGWTMTNGNDPSRAGEFEFRATMHDTEPKTVLGVSLAGELNEQAGERMLDLLAQHEKAAEMISLKLARRFVADAPPKDVVQLGMAAFTKSQGDIRATLGAMLHSEEFKKSLGGKYKRPFEFVASALRALGAQTDGGKPLHVHLKRMGQPLFLWSPPNGYPDVRGAWLSSRGMLGRYNFAYALTHNTLSKTKVSLKAIAPSMGNAMDALSMRILGSALPDQQKAVLKPFADQYNLAMLSALMLSMPAFQLRG
jgi:uncharacterized protein (DUF1800 family)